MSLVALRVTHWGILWVPVRNGSWSIRLFGLIQQDSYVLAPPRGWGKDILGRYFCLKQAGGGDLEGQSGLKSKGIIYLIVLGQSLLQDYMGSVKQAEGVRLLLGFWCLLILFADMECMFK